MGEKTRKRKLRVSKMSSIGWCIGRTTPNGVIHFCHKTMRSTRRDCVDDFRQIKFMSGITTSFECRRKWLRSGEYVVRKIRITEEATP